MSNTSGKTEQTNAALQSSSAPLFSWALIVLFLLCISLPGIQTFTRVLPEKQSTENRSLAPIPQMGFTQVKEFPARFEAWFNDAFGFRQSLVTAYNFLTVVVLRTSSHPLVQLGSNGWLYYTDGQSTEDARGVLLLSVEQLEKIRQRVRLQTELLNKRGVKYLIAICPNKQSIHPEHLPSYMRNKLGPTRLDQILDYLRKHEPALDILDLRPTLNEAKKRYPVFLITDSHWNDYGALCGFGAICDYLQRSWYPALGQPIVSAYKVESHMGGTCGDLSVNMLALPKVYREQWVTTAFAGDSVSLTAQQTPKVLVFGDSFYDALKPYFERHFAHVTFMKRYICGIDYALVDSLKPDVVIYQIVERNLDAFLIDNLQ